MSERHARGPLRNLVEYAAARVGETVFLALPERAAARLGRLFGRIAFAVDRRHRRVAIANVECALGLARAQAFDIARRSFEHLGEVASEMVRSPRLLRGPGFRRRVQLRGAEVVERALASGRGLVIATAHLGNWEIAGHGFALLGHPFHVVSRALDNPLIGRRVYEIRQASGYTLLDKRGSSGEIASLLRHGHVVAVISDQRSSKNGVLVPFLGRPALTTLAPAMLSLRTRSPLATASIRRLPGGGHVIEIEPPIEWTPTRDLRSDLERLTALVNERIGARIRECPEQYLWAHDRWRPPRSSAAAPAR
ncbi:MAG: lysophospholipid acyltransferase family protein [Planctomycetales bacterium]|nr:lysophospholipid acyltransferase family protein [Planctomycetales bacterium]